MVKIREKDYLIYDEIVNKKVNISDYCEKKMPSVQDLEKITEKLYEKYKECRQWTLKQNEKNYMG